MSQSVNKTDISTNNYIRDTFITEPPAIFFQSRAQQEKVIFEFAWCTCNIIGARDNWSTTTPGAGHGGKLWQSSPVATAYTLPSSSSTVQKIPANTLGACQIGKPTISDNFKCLWWSVIMSCSFSSNSSSSGNHTRQASLSIMLVYSLSTLSLVGGSVIGVWFGMHGINLQHFFPTR